MSITIPSWPRFSTVNDGRKAGSGVLSKSRAALILHDKSEARDLFPELRFFSFEFFFVDLAACVAFLEDFPALFFRVFLFRRR